MRLYPTSLTRKGKLRRWLRSWLGSDGAILALGGHEVTFFYPGLGRRLRRPGGGILQKLVSGEITDIVDVGGGGALDPALRRGELVLGSVDVASDTPAPLPLRRRPEMPGLVEALARQLGVGYRRAPLLTHDRGVFSRRERLRVRSETGCSVVQIEHAWFLRLLQQLIGPKRFARLCVTHVEVVADIVPPTDSWFSSVFELLQALLRCFFFSQRYLGGVKSAFLRSWLG
jgi:hypothetical protein